MVSIQSLLQSAGVQDADNAHDIGTMNITGIAYHSQKVQPGHLFVCLKGHQTDGHRYLKQAVQAGAVAAIVEERQNVDIPQIVVDNSRVALAQMAAAFYDHPSQKLKMIGITAANGKTTTAHMVNSILETSGRKTGVTGTVEIKIDETRLPTQLTTPESLDLQYYLKQMVDRQVSHAVMEVSSAALDMHRVASVDYDIVSFHNISREHIDFHHSFENYFAAKSRLITQASPDSVAILNLDCPHAASLVQQTQAKVLTFSVSSQQGHVYCEDLDLSSGKARFTVHIAQQIEANDVQIPPTRIPLELNVPGLHSVYNALLATVISLLCGVQVEVIQQSLRAFSGVKRRFECIHDDVFTIYDDQYSNPEQINVSLQTIQNLNYRKLHLVYAIRGQRGPVMNAENAEAIAYWLNKLKVQHIIATASASHVTAKDKVTTEERNIFLDTMSKADIEVFYFEELPDALSQALAEAGEGDMIVLAGCQGMDHGAEIMTELLQHMAESRGEVRKAMP